jgi:Fe-S cluster assembly iron-binding protein IscA
MLSVTDTALEQLHESLENANDQAKCFRVMPKDAANLTLKYMNAETSDRTFDFKGRTVLALPKELEPYCMNKQLDVNDSGRLELA